MKPRRKKNPPLEDEGAESLLRRANAILARAEHEDVRVSVAALTAVSRLHLAIHPPGEDFAKNPEWIALRDKILDVLDAFPEALEALMKALDPDETSR